MKHSTMPDNISIIVPVLNEAAQLADMLAALQALRERGHELIVADGGSRDGSVTIARKWADRVIMSGAGRALQMNAGAEHARHEVLLFLHADTRLPERADQLILQALDAEGRVWGRFDVRLASARPLFRVIETAINWRSALSGIATGDQAIFVRRSWFEKVGAYDGLPLMEDVALSKKLLRHARPQRITTPVHTSSRKWERDGIVRTMLLMWQLRAAYALGVHPDKLVARYYPPESAAPDSSPHP
jgi:rSAM/selenodomain-associated transferase 2